MAGIGLAATATAAGAASMLGGLEGNTASPAHAKEAAPTAPDPLRAHGLAAADADSRATLAGLEPGQVIEGHWRVESIFAVRAGAVPVILSTTHGERFAVEIFRADPSSRAAPLGEAPGLALYLVNRGDGSTVTDEAAGLGVQALGRALAARRAGEEAPASLTSLGERQRRHPGGIFTVPV